MKTLLIVLVTALTTWVLTSLVHSVQTAAQRTWMLSALKAPGTMALRDLQEDMSAKRYELARAKIDALMNAWQAFVSGPDSYRNPGIGNVMVAFSQIDTNHITTNPEPGTGGNR